MSNSIPAPGHQGLPRSVLLAPEGDPLPVGMFRKLLQRGKPLALLYQGHGLVPWLKQGETFMVDAALPLRRGDLALCDVGGTADVRRLLRRGPGRWLTVLDPLPTGREWLSDEKILGRVESPGHQGGGWIAVLFPLYSRRAALRLWGRRIALELAPAAAPDDSIRAKYEGQVEEYADVAREPLRDFVLQLAGRAAAPPASLLIAGCGAGNEAVGLAQAGYRVAAFDFIAAMAEAGARSARAAGVEAEFFQADLTTLELPGRSFDAAYLTSLLYGFIPGRATRIEGLRRIGAHVKPGGAVILSVKFIRGPSAWLRHTLVWLRQRLRGNRAAEFGDWHTWYLAPGGRLATSFTRRFTGRQLRAETRAAGFRTLRAAGEGHFLLTDFQGAGRCSSDEIQRRPPGL